MIERTHTTSTHGGVTLAGISGAFNILPRIGGCAGNIISGFAIPARTMMLLLVLCVPYGLLIARY